MTTQVLKRLCKLWQKRLRISDWTISVSLVPLAEMGDAWGDTLYDPRQCVAEIRIALEHEDSIYLDLGFEQTLIHELLHIVMHGWVDYQHEDIMQERSINHIADALYWAYRPKRGKSDK